MLDFRKPSVGFGGESFVQKTDWFHQKKASINFEAFVGV